jgi:hypothetical protein
MSAIISETRGDAFDYSIGWEPAADAPPTVEFLTITSQVRTIPVAPAVLGDLVADVVITKHPDFMGWDALVLDTSTWPLGQLEWDFKCVQAGRAAHSEKVLLQIMRGVTE